MNENTIQTEQLLAELREQNNRQAELIRLLKDKDNPREEKDDAEGGTTIDIKSIVVSLLRYWWLIVIATVICGGIVAFLCYRNYTETYSATAKMYVNNNSVSIGATQVSITSGDLTAAQSLVQTYCEIIKTHRVLDEAILQLKEDYGYEYDYFDLFDKVSCGAVNKTEIFYITVTDTDKDRVIKTVNVIAQLLEDGFIKDVIVGSETRTVDKAKESRLINPGFTKKIAVGALAGFVLACGYAFLRGCVFNDLIEDESWLEEQYASIPVLAEIPDANAAHSGHKYGKYGYGHYSSYSYASSYENDGKGKGE